MRPSILIRNGLASMVKKSRKQMKERKNIAKKARNGLASKVKKSRKQMKNIAKKIRGVEKLKAGDVQKVARCRTRISG